MNQRNDRTKNRLFEMDDKLFDILSNKILFDEAVYKDNKFIIDIEEYKNFSICVKNTYDFYKYIATKSINDFEEETKGIIGKINIEEKEKLIQAKNEDVKIIEDNDDDDIYDIGEF